MGVRLMVVDDHRLLAEALASALKLRGHRVLAAAAPSAGAAELVVSRAPEVCLLGTAAPARPGAFDPVVRIKKERPQVAVVVLGPVPSPRGIAAAFAAGASGYVRNDERIEGVERAMMKARAGESAVAPQLLQQAFEELLHPAAQPDDEGARLLELLTPREVEVLMRVADGEDTRLIAAGMDIAPSTARTHVQRVLMKLEVGSRLEAAALAARTGLLDRAAGGRAAARTAAGTEAAEGAMAGPERFTAGPDHTTAGPDHTTAGPDRFTAGPDHTTAGPDRFTAGPDHTTAGPDRFTAGPDHTTVGPDQADPAPPPQ